MMSTTSTSKTETNDLTSEEITTKTLIPPESPTVIKLKQKKDTFGSFTRITLGDKNENQTNKTILLVGETGAGKSTLVNTLVNYTKGTKFEDDVWFQITEEEKKSQKSDVIMYQIFGFKGQSLPYSLTIIDTPGYGDTRGTEYDNNISQKLLDLFQSEDGVHEINAVGLVMKASDNRLNDRLMYVFDSVMSLFGNDLEKNIVALITHSDGRKPKNPLDALEDANIISSKSEFRYFLFNNCQHEDRTEDRELLERAHKISLKGFKEFFHFLDKTDSQPLEKTVEVLNDRIRLMASIQNLKERIKLTELKQKEIRQTEEALKKHEEEMNKNKEFTGEVDEDYKEKEPVTENQVCGMFKKVFVTCSVCQQNCYQERIMAWQETHCEVMKDVHCTVCKCSASDHVKENWKYVTKTRKVPTTKVDMKEKYEKNEAEYETKKSLLENLERETIKLTTEWSLLLDQAYNHVINLEQIALKAESVSTLVHLDFLIEKMKESGDQEKVQKLEEMKSQVNEGTNTALRYAQI